MQFWGWLVLVTPFLFFLLKARFELGEFDPPEMVPFRNASRYNAAALTPPLQELALSAAKQSLVLLKNKFNVLPLLTATVGEADIRLMKGGPHNEAAKLPSALVSAPFAVVGIEKYMDAGYDYPFGFSVKSKEREREVGG